MTETAIQPVTIASNDANTADIVPAVRVALTGEHLIEASAGTGKTWTLTGILLRLLIEAKRSPEQIIATTFTRAAAAEMRQRVHERLLDFYQVLQWLSSLQDSPEFKQDLYPEALQIIPDDKDNKSKADNPATKLPKIHASARAKLKALREEWLKQQAKLAGMSEQVDDPINLHLVGFLLDNVITYPLADAVRRTELVLTTLDKLFVGTLDSLAQKWLAEYSAETGFRQGMGITEDIEAVTDGIIHDELRRFQSQLYHGQPRIYHLLQQQGKLTKIDDHRGAVTKALTFISAPIDEILINESFNFIELEALLEDFKSFDLQDVEPYFDKEYRKDNGFHGSAAIGTKITSIKDIVIAINQYGYNFYKHLDEDAEKFYGGVREVFPNKEGKIKGFTKNKEEFYQRFVSLKTIKALKAIHDKTDELDNYLSDIITQLNRNIVMSARDKLASILEERNETTFTLQMVRLNQALSGRQGQKLARYIRHHYPVALIDESQDINGEQAQMIESIYLPSKTNNPTHTELVNSAINNTSTSNADTNSANNRKGNTFLLLVGDPKQAIYGFRGGDVANYNYMKSKFNHSIMTLTVNRRSNAQLIDALNHWFGCPMPLKITHDNEPEFELSPANQNSLSKNNVNSQVLSELGDNIHYQYIKAHNQHARLSWQLDKDLINTSLTDDNRIGKADLEFEIAPDSMRSDIDDLLPINPVTIIHLPKDDKDYDESEATAFHIAALLNSQQTIEGRAIRPSDIGVLGRRKVELKRVEDLLTKLNIPTLATSEVSIFETTMAADLVSLLEAMLRSYRRDTINRALTSQFFGLSLRQVKAMMTRHDDSRGADSDLALADFTGENENSQRYQDFITHIKEAAERWQKRGILPALHYLLGKSPIHPKGAWQSLAALPNGERYIMDLRHLMDILAQYTMNMGEHELLSWYKQNITLAPKGDWAKQQSLPTESGVQLMTIHKSKGLEFPIVYVLGMDSASHEAGSREDHGLYLYNTQSIDTQSDVVKQIDEGKRQLSPVKGKLDDTKFFTEIESTENYNERKRLGYVAFTRASEQLYIVLKDLSKKTSFNRRPAFFWLDCQDKEFVLPERLSSQVGWIAGSKIFDYQELQQDKQSNLSLADNVPSNDTKIATPILYPDLDQLMPDKFFYGWAKTSFTALARQLGEQSQSLAVIDERIDDDIYIATTKSWNSAAGLNSDLIQDDFTTTLKNADNIRFSFVKGANAGTFLHEVFEKIDFTDQRLWPAVIDKAIRSYQLPMSYASEAQQQRATGNKQQASQENSPQIVSDDDQNEVVNSRSNDSKQPALIEWIAEILDTPLLASNQSLKSIPAEQRFAELSFNMGLSENFHAEGLNELFVHHFPDEPDKHIVLTKHNIPHLYRYLRGEIDLVYEYAGKYYVVDYKSNYLGNSLSNYNEETLSETMSKAGYWLQAAIYQVALHRFLSIRIDDYVDNEAKYLGAVEYVFLRGTLTSHVNSDNLTSTLSQERFGLVKWAIPIDFIKALDSAFGKPSR